MDSSDIAILLGMLVVFTYGLASDPSTGSDVRKPYPAATQPPEPIHADAVLDNEEDDLDFSLPCPPNWAIQEAMDAFYLPMAPAFSPFALQSRDCASVPGQVNGVASIPATVAMATDSPGRDVSTSTSIPAVPSTAAAAPASPAKAGGSPSRKRVNVEAMRHLDLHSPESPASPAPTVLRLRSVVETGGSGSPLGIPRARRTLEPQLQLEVPALTPVQDPGPLSGEDRASSCETWGRSSSDGGSGSDPEGTVAQEAPLPIPAASNPTPAGPRTREPGRLDPQSPVSVLVRAAEFESLSCSKRTPCPRPPSSQAGTPPAAGTAAWVGSSGGSSVSRAPKTMSRVTCSGGTSGGAGGSSTAAMGHNLRYASSGGSLLRARAPGSAGGGSAFASHEGGGGGRSTAPAPSFLAVARASQSRALASASPTASPASPVTASAKRLAKPNMPRIAGL